MGDGKAPKNGVEGSKKEKKRKRKKKKKRKEKETQKQKQNVAANIRLTRCKNCGQLVDKYVEYDAVLIAIDLVLHKVEVYRHLLFNSDSAKAKDFGPLMQRAFCGVVLIDTYVKWWTRARSGNSPQQSDDLRVCADAFGLNDRVRSR